MNGMIDQKKYNLHFDLGEGRNKQLLNNQKEREQEYPLRGAARIAP